MSNVDANNILIDCPACGRRVSREAIACPECAHPIARQHVDQGEIRGGSSSLEPPLPAHDHSKVGLDNRGILAGVFSFRGRTSRSVWALVYLINAAVWSAALWAVAVLSALEWEDPSTLVFLAAVVGVSVWAVAATGVRRFHDQNRSGWWLLLAFVPLINVVVIGVLAATAGSNGENSYGREPPRLSSSAAGVVSVLWVAFLVGGVAQVGAGGWVEPLSMTEGSAQPPPATRPRVVVSTTTTPLATTTTVRASSSIRPPTNPALTDRGIGKVPFGIDADVALLIPEGYFGAPSYDTGWSEADFLWCIRPEAERAVEWEDRGLLVLLVQGGQGLYEPNEGFVAYLHIA